MHIPDLAGNDLEDNPGDDTKHDTVRDRVRKGHGDDGEEAADGIGDIAVEVHLGDVFDHQQSDKYQRGSCREGRNCQENRIEGQRQEEQDGGSHRRQTGFAALGNAGGGLNVRGNGRGTEYSAADSTDSIRHQRAADAGQLAVFIQKAALLRHTDEGADGVKEVNEQERKDDDRKIHGIRRDIRKIKLEEGGRRHGLHRSEYSVVAEIGDNRRSLIPAGDLRDDAEHPGDENTNQDSALDSVVPERRNHQYAEERQNDRRGADVAELNERGRLHRLAVKVRVCRHDAGAFETDNDNEQTDTGGNAELEVGGNLVNESFSELEDGENDKNQALAKNRGQRDAPGVCNALRS